MKGPVESHLDYCIFYSLKKIVKNEKDNSQMVQGLESMVDVVTLPN